LVISEAVEALPTTDSGYNAKDEHCYQTKNKKEGKRKCQE